MFKKGRGYLILMVVITFLFSSVSCNNTNTSKEVSSNTENQVQNISSDSPFAKHRNALVEKIDDNSILVLYSERSAVGTEKELEDNSPNRNFYYVTGIAEQNSILLVSKNNGKLTEYIFTSTKDNNKKFAEMKKASGINNILEISKFDEEFKNIVKTKKMTTLYLDLGAGDKNPTSQAEKFKNTASMEYSKLQQKNIFYDVAILRMIKNEDEINNIRKAIEVTNEGILNMMKNSKENVAEADLEVCFNSTLNNAGISSTGFDSIIGSGKNGTLVHYFNNDSIAPKDGLVLVDVGAEYNYYSADISRTFPANGKFTERQKQIYNIVLKTQEEVIKAIKPGATTAELQALCIKILTEECTKIGLMKATTDIRDYYMHGVSHHLGLDVHDATVQKTPLQPGMILTVEPGLYINEEGMGIRIEDDVLVTETGCEILSKDMIKTVEEIESFMKK